MGRIESVFIRKRIDVIISDWVRREGRRKHVWEVYVCRCIPGGKTTRDYDLRNK